MWSKTLRRCLALVLATGLVLLNIPPIALAQTPAPEEKIRIAVLDFKLVEVDEAAGVLMVDKLRSDLVNTQKFIVLDRAQSDKILAELERQQTGLTDQATSTRIGQQFNVGRIVTGRVAAVKSLGIIQVNVEMIEMRTAQIVVSQTLTYDGEMKGFIFEKVPEIVALIVGETPTPPVAAKSPEAPPGVVATPGGQGQVTLVWKNVEGADRYNVYFSTLPGVNRASATKISGVSSPFHHAGLADDTAYYYIVTAENEAGESADSNEANAITASASKAPPQPVAKEGGTSGLYVTGVVMVILGGVAQVAALAAATTAADDATTAAETDDPELYQKALDDRQAAESTQGAAIVLIGVGALFMFLGGGDSDSSASLEPGNPAGFQVAFAPHTVKAGYTMRW